MTSRVLIVPAAGLGTRLGGNQPKLLVPVAGVPMIDRLLALFGDTVSEAVIVVHPSFAADVGQHLDRRARAPSATTATQPAPTGMLDAILLAGPRVSRSDADEVWIVWCDQVAIHPATIRRLADVVSQHRDAAVVMPTVRRSSPYIHLERDREGRIIRILHRREGDAMPISGESDMGLFALPRPSFTTLLPRYAQHVDTGAATGERNFLPFLAWANAEHDVITFPAHEEMEAVGVNTQEDLRVVEACLARRESARL